MQHTPYFYYRPHRLLWFILGAGAATWWFKYKDIPHRANYCATFGPNSRPLAAWPSEKSNVNAHEIAHWRPRVHRNWDEHPVDVLSHQAADTAAGITEAALDQVLSVAEALKAKLAEYRTQRQELDEGSEEEQRREPPERLA